MARIGHNFRVVAFPDYSDKGHSPPQEGTNMKGYDELRPYDVSVIMVHNGLGDSIETIADIADVSVETVQKVLSCRPHFMSDGTLIRLGMVAYHYDAFYGIILDNEANRREMDKPHVGDNCHSCDAWFEVRDKDGKGGIYDCSRLARKGHKDAEPPTSA